MSYNSCTILIPGMRELRQEQSGHESQGVKWCWKRTKENAINGNQKDSVREETSEVSGTMEINGKSRLQNPLHPPYHQHKEVEVRREKEASEAAVFQGRPIDSRAGTSWKVLAQNYFVTIGIFPSVNFIYLNRYAHSARIGRSRTGRSMNKRIKRRRRVVTKMQEQ